MVWQSNEEELNGKPDSRILEKCQAAIVDIFVKSLKSVFYRKYQVRAPLIMEIDFVMFLFKRFLEWNRQNLQL